MKPSDGFDTDAFLVFVRDTVPHNWDMQILNEVERTAKKRTQR